MNLLKIESKIPVAFPMKMTSIWIGLFVCVGLLASCSVSPDPTPRPTATPRPTPLPPNQPKISTLDIGGSPSKIAVAGENVWVADKSDPTLTRISKTGEVLIQIELSSSANLIAASEKNVWAWSRSTGSLDRFSLAGELEFSISTEADHSVLRYFADKLWLAGADTGRVSIITLDASEFFNPYVGVGAARMIQHGDIMAVPISGESRVVMLTGDGEIESEYPSSGLPSPAYAGAGGNPGPDVAASDGENVWVGFIESLLIARHDSDGSQTGVLDVPVAPELIEVGSADIWVGSKGGAEVARVDASTLELNSVTLEVGLGDMTLVDDVLWLTLPGAGKIAFLTP